MICGSILKTSMPFLFFQIKELRLPPDGSCSPLRVGKRLGSQEQADQAKMTRTTFALLHTGISNYGQRDPRKDSQENKKGW